MKLRNLAAIGVMLIALQQARADIIFNLTPPVLTTSPGGTAEFTGTLENTGTSDVFWNGDSVVLLSSFLTLYDTPFFTDAPLFLPSEWWIILWPIF